MAASEDRKEFREINTRLRIKMEDLERLKEEVKILKEQRSAMKEKIDAAEAAS
ncbi:hypothetical protein [Mangrovicoccus sp. HB161399]|uniref:hypothetical protein n=1 Tax=Mangrovicoccus sp. HB161399 TaxID=2720392 RepID=UPI001557E0D3|nr:hypothetical protein [Mangrovicoccus sp. HB161399]